MVLGSKPETHLHMAAYFCCFGSSQRVLMDQPYATHRKPKTVPGWRTWARFSDVRVRVCPLSRTVKISPSCPTDAPSRLPRGARRLTRIAICRCGCSPLRRPRRALLTSVRAFCSTLRRPRHASLWRPCTRSAHH